jgi:hypothetical protein
MAAEESRVDYQRIVIDAARCWSRARNRRQALQVALSRLLLRRNLVILSPVFDSLLHLYEAALGRPMRIGRSMHASHDERLLLAMIAADRVGRQCRGGGDGRVASLGNALRSTRIMLRLAMGDSGAGRPALA